MKIIAKFQDRELWYNDEYVTDHNYLPDEVYLHFVKKHGITHILDHDTRSTPTLYTVKEFFG